MIYKHIITVDYVILKLIKKRGKKNGSSRLLRWRGFNGLIIDHRSILFLFFDFFFLVLWFTIGSFVVGLMFVICIL